jgi:hypothetical protein
MGRRHVLECLACGRVIVPCSIGHYLGYLSPGGISCRPVIRQVARRYAWLARLSATLVTTNQPAIGHPLHPDIVGVGGWHVLELARPWVLIEPGRSRYHVGKVITSDKGVHAEVIGVVRATRLIWTATRETLVYASASQAPDERIEGVC